MFTYVGSVLDTGRRMKTKKFFVLYIEDTNMTIGKFFTLATIFVAAFTLGSCSKDDDEEESNNSKSDNHEYVDLGLPSGTLWATCNVGASQPEEYGDYFAWGETQPKKAYDFDNYKWGDGSGNVTKYCEYSICGTVDNKSELLPEDDAATANWGSSWRTPSTEQIKELLNSGYTTLKWTTLNGVNGYQITSKQNGKTLFLPAAGSRAGEGELDKPGVRGQYWSRSLCSLENGSACADEIEFYSGYIADGLSNRVSGQSVRPVRK